MTKQTNHSRKVRSGTGGGVRGERTFGGGRPDLDVIVDVHDDYPMSTETSSEVSV